jgi:hypothetical protein
MGPPSALHECPTRRSLATHEKSDPNYAFVANHGDFGGGAACHNAQKRDYGVNGEIDMRQGSPGLTNDFAEGQRNQLELGREPFEYFWCQRREQLIPRGLLHGRVREIRNDMVHPYAFTLGHFCDPLAPEINA